MTKIPIEEYAGSHSLSASFGDIMNPWSLPTQTEAPEDIETPLPCSFTDALHYMELPYEEAAKEFLLLVNEHVTPGFRQATDIDNLLKTKRVNVFVTSNWERVKGLPPIEQKWKEGVPEHIKRKACPINLRLLAK